MPPRVEERIPSWVLLLGVFLDLLSLCWSYKEFLGLWQDGSGTYQLSWINPSFRQPMIQPKPLLMHIHAFSAHVWFLCFYAQVSDKIRGYSLSLHRWIGRVGLAVFWVSNCTTPYTIWFMKGSQLSNWLLFFFTCLIFVMGHAVYATIGARWLMKPNLKLHAALGLRLWYLAFVFAQLSRVAFGVVRVFVSNENTFDVTVYLLCPFAAFTMEYLAYWTHCRRQKPQDYRFLGLFNLK
jgi:hypothetical protein